MYNLTRNVWLCHGTMSRNPPINKTYYSSSLKHIRKILRLIQRDYDENNLNDKNKFIPNLKIQYVRV